MQRQPGGGRKPMEPGLKVTHQISTVVDEATHLRLTKRTQAERKSMSAILREIVVDAMDVTE